MPNFDCHSGWQPERVEHGGVLRFFDKARDAAILGDLQDAERLRRLPADGNRGDGDVRAGLGVLADDAAEIHPIQLVAAQDEQVIEIVVEKVDEIFAHGVGGAFIPRRVGERLLRREDFHEAAGKLVEFIRPRNVAVQRGGIELRQNVNAPEAGVDAVGNRDVHQPVFAGQRHGGLGALLGEREQARALPAAHDDGEDVADIDGLATAVQHNLDCADNILPPATAGQAVDAELFYDAVRPSRTMNGANSS